nr:thioesterase family protein [Fonticella tunisiensis]
MDNIKVGLSAVIETISQPKDSAVNYASGVVDVFSTPSMIALMECAAKNAVDLHLEKGYTTVGTRIHIKHIAATPTGMRIKACAELVKREGKKLIFKVEAYDEVEKIGEGIHERHVVNIDKFISRAMIKRKK